MTGPRRLGWDSPAPGDLFDHIIEPDEEVEDDGEPASA